MFRSIPQPSTPLGEHHTHLIQGTRTWSEASKHQNLEPLPFALQQFEEACRREAAFALAATHPRVAQAFRDILLAL